MARYAAPRRAQADHTAERGRRAHGTARVLAERGGTEGGGHGNARARRGAARVVVGIPGVARLPEGELLGAAQGVVEDEEADLTDEQDRQQQLHDDPPPAQAGRRRRQDGHQQRDQHHDQQDERVRPMQREVDARLGEGSVGGEVELQTDVDEHCQRRQQVQRAGGCFHADGSPGGRRPHTVGMK